MEWGKLYASLPDHPRVQAAEDDGGAGWLLVQSMCYCTSAESDGFIPDTQIPRFGGPRLKQRVAALAREQVWIRDDSRRGYVLDPTIWSEEKNLSDQAERKRKADRERIAAKRATARASQNGHVSRDSSATSSTTPGATCSGDSRSAEKKRKELPPLTPPLAGGNQSRCARHKRPRRNCEDCTLPPLVPVPDKCDRCNPSRRIEDSATGQDLGPCPACHPSTVREAS
jgi:hypothetical protein